VQSLRGYRCWDVFDRLSLTPARMSDVVAAVFTL
jgi:hypothetical protein